MATFKRNPRTVKAVFVLAFAGLVAATSSRAQELEPRAYSLSPIGTNFFLTAIGSLSGDVLFDPTLPITDVHANIDLLTVGYGRTYSLGGRLGSVAVAVPAAYAHVEGQVLEQAKSVRRRGFADVRLRTSLIFLGGKAMSPPEFARAPRKTVFGASLVVQAPSGQYDETRLINLGTNRWAFKPELGVSVPVGHWSLDAYAGVWLFTKNEAFYPGASVKRQDPLTSIQAHASYTFKNRAWLALDATWYGGGEVTVDSNDPSSPYSNSRIGGTFSMPVASGQSVKLAASKGASARTGTDFTAFLFAWQIVWFDKASKRPM